MSHASPRSALLATLLLGFLAAAIPASAGTPHKIFLQSDAPGTLYIDGNEVCTAQKDATAGGYVCSGTVSSGSHTFRVTISGQSGQASATIPDSWDQVCVGALGYSDRVSVSVEDCNEANDY